MRELKTDAVVSVYGAFGDKLALPVKVVALWDTGASSSVISERIARALGLVPVNHTRACGVNGWYESPVYVVDIMLPNRMKIAGVSVSRGELVAADMLIGMDVISMGDMLLVRGCCKTLGGTGSSPSAVALERDPPILRREVLQLPLKCRIRRAQDLLKEERMSVTDIAYELGFSSPQNFAIRFRQETGMSPTAMRH